MLQMNMHGDMMLSCCASSSLRYVNSVVLVMSDTQWLV